MDMPVVLTLPPYVAGADLAETMIAALDPQAVVGADVQLDARSLTTSSSSFARGCVERLLVTGGARRLVVRGGPAHFRQYLLDAARAYGVDVNRIAVEPSAAPLSHAS